MKASDLVDDDYCFACGKSNPLGLRIEWTVSGRTTEGRFVPRREHQGWKGVVHGGIVASLLDEAMTRLAWKVHGTVLTGQLNVRFLKPARVGDTLTARAEVSEMDGRKIATQARLMDAAGTVLAEATGISIKVRDK